MTIQNNGTPTRLGGITGRGFLPGKSGNPGGRPRGLAAAARAVVGTDGHGLIEFFAAVLRADRKYLGERRVTLRDRMAAATWLADRAFGRGVQVVEVPDDPEKAEASPHSPASVRPTRSHYAFPPIDGVAAHWGRGVFHCPYCDGGKCGTSRRTRSCVWKETEVR